METREHQAGSGGDPPPYVDHQGPHRQYIRDIILGVNDGLVSIFLLVAGVVAGGLSSSAVLLTGIAGAIAGAVSMAAGEYIATKSQEEVFEGELALEREHLLHHRDHELGEIREWFTEMGLESGDVERVVEALDKNEEGLLRVMMALEFGVVDQERRNPYTAMVMSGVLFLLGALPSIVPFALTDSTSLGLMVAAIGSGIGLLAVGALKTLATRGNPWRGAAENLIIATGGALVSFGIGSLFDVSA